MRLSAIKSFAALSGLSIVLFLLSPALAFDDPSILEAQRLFKQFVDLERAYDPAQADLYAPQAVIKDTRVYQDGENKTLTWTGDSYRQIIKAQLPVARARNEQFVYSQMSYSKEGNNVRLRCTRSLPSRKFSSPLEMVFAPAQKNGWKIVEETCQSQP